jgi:hypothetical protein
MEILDVADFPASGNPKKFDEADVARFLREFDDRRGATDHSRFDLNGDGLIGAALGFDRVNLDGSGGPAPYAEVGQTIEETTVPFDENLVTDLDVLCYYAYSGLYEGDEVQRAQQLALRCAQRPNVEIVVENVPESPEPGVTFLLQVSVQLTSQDGTPIVLRNAPLTFFVRQGGQVLFLEEDGTVIVLEPGDNDWATDTDGGFITLTALRLPDASQMEIGFFVPDPRDANAPPLAEKTLRIPEECPAPGPQGSFQSLGSLAAPAADDVCEEPGGGGGGGSVPPQCDPLVVGDGGVDCFDHDCWGTPACTDPISCRGARGTFTVAVPGGGCAVRFDCLRFLLDDPPTCSMGCRPNVELLRSCGLWPNWPFGSWSLPNCDFHGHVSTIAGDACR